MFHTFDVAVDSCSYVPYVQIAVIVIVNIEICNDGQRIDLLARG